MQQIPDAFHAAVCMADGSYSVAALCYRDRDREFMTPPDYAQDRHVTSLGGATWQPEHQPEHQQGV